jgi:hypothetical protein
MSAHRTPAGGAARHAAGLVPVSVGWTIAGGALCATVLLASLLLPPSLVLLATGTALATAGFATAAALFLSGRRMGSDGTAGWDLASSLVLLGFAAALLTDTAEALRALAELGSELKAELGAEPRAR